ncbi:molybdopterin-dependent oxidoreductase [Chloroflexota bacterium]
MEEKVFYNSCPAAGCHRFCALKVWVKDGKINKVESADYPDNPAARRICLKGLSSTRLVYHPDRLQYPLKRAGERGEGKWQRTTWDEALDTIASKLLELKEKYGSQTLKITVPWASSSVGLLMGRLMRTRFANVWGAGGDFETKGVIADAILPSASLLTLGNSGQCQRVEDYIHSKMLILWGGNLAETAFPDMKFVLDARDNGARLVVIGPLFNATAAKADQWIPVRPGTDGALALALMNVIIEEGHYDKDYLAKYTVAPFLVRGDSKCFLRDAGKCLVWDEDANTLMPYDQATRPALLGSFMVRDVRCQTAFQLLTETAAQYRPEKAAEITGVPAETIRKLALEYATTKPAAIRMSDGANRTLYSALGCRATITLGALTGNIGIQGGGVSTANEPRSVVLNTEGVVRPPGTPGLKTIPGSRSIMRGWTAIREGKPHPIKALINEYQNPMHCYGHIEGYRDIFSQMELIVVMDIFMTRTAQYADIVLPEATIFERDDIQGCGDYLLIMEKAIEPLYETRSPLEIWSELARRVGLGKYFEYTLQDYIKILLDSGHPSADGITLERLEREKIIRGNLPPTVPIPFIDKIFPTPSGRIEFYKEHLVEFGQELPIYREPPESPGCSPLAQQYPLIFLTVKDRTFMHSQMHNVDWMREIAPEPVLDINPVDASRREIKNGDMVVVFNDRGKAKLKARLNEAVPPGAVKAIHGWWPEQFAEGHYSDLLHRVDDLSIIDHALEMEPVTSDTRAAVALPFYDCLVEVKRT